MGANLISLIHACLILKAFLFKPEKFEKSKRISQVDETPGFYMENKIEVQDADWAEVHLKRVPRQMHSLGKASVCRNNSGETAWIVTHPKPRTTCWDLSGSKPQDPSFHPSGNPVSYPLGNVEGSSYS